MNRALSPRAGSVKRTVATNPKMYQSRVSADAEYLDGITDVEQDNTVKDRTSAYDQASNVNSADIRQIDLSVQKTVTSPASGDSVQVGGQIAYLLTVKIVLANCLEPSWRSQTCT